MQAQRSEHAEVAWQELSAEAAAVTREDCTPEERAELAALVRSLAAALEAANRTAATGAAAATAALAAARRQLRACADGAVVRVSHTVPGYSFKPHNLITPPTCRCSYESNVMQAMADLHSAAPAPLSCVVQYAVFGSDFCLEGSMSGPLVLRS